ncbi:MAG: TIGR02266 family protein [Polyangiales bacterium]
MADTRKDKRAPLSLKVRFKSATLDEFVEQYSYDISRGGIFIKSKKPMKVGTLLKFEFQLKDESSLIHGVGRVVWRRDPEEGGPAPGMGIKFIKMDPDSRAFVQKIVDERENAPGTFDAGEAGPKKEEDFFPAGAPQQIDPEDRTQVRHASEFLAEALSESDGAAEEAEAEAAAARVRTEEIQREREAAEREARAAEERAKEREAEQAAARNDVAEEKEAESANEEADKKPAKSSEPPAAAAAAAKEADKADSKPKDDDKSNKDKPRDDKPKAAAAADKNKASKPEKAKKPAAPKAAPAPAPADEPGGNGMVIGLIIAIAAAGGGYFWWQGQQTDDPAETVNVEPETPEVAEEPIEEPVVEPIEEPAVESVTASVNANVGAEILVGGEVIATILDEPVSIDIPAEGAEVVARARGYRSQTLNATEGAELSFELEALPWIVRVTALPEGSRISIGGRVVRSSERTYTEAPTEAIVVAATRRGYLAANREVAPAEFTAGEDAMTANITLTLQERPTTAMTTTTTRMTTAMTTAMEAEPAVMEAVEAVVMEAAPVVMEAAPVVMEASTPIVMDAPAMEAATMEAAPPDTVPDNPF